MSLPPFPEPTDIIDSTNDERYVASGGWLISYEPTASFLVAYDGTLRIEDTMDGAKIASGDLYQRTVILIPNHPSSLDLPSPKTPTPILGPAPAPANGIPIQARA